MAPALALARAGIGVQVHEQAQQPTEASADLSLAPNGRRMLKWPGVGEGIGRVAARHGPTQLPLSGAQPARQQPHQ
jgi:2-polyprenyl-6-methoxyphenol hydroxylase-like FAD-dependent oxidoreductase